MSAELGRSIARREFLRQGALGALAVGVSGLAARSASAGEGEDAPGTHNMLVVGESKIFLSHLPMFDGLDRAKTAFRSPHRFQVILEASFANGGKDAGNLYQSDRKAHPQTRIYTLSPELFVLSRLFTPANPPALAAFTATVFRGHLEQGGKPIAGLEKTRVTVNRVVHGRMFEPQAKKPGGLEYILFGSGSELFMAHTVFGPPDFDHVLAVKLPGRQLTDAELSGDLRVLLPERKNAAADRLREKERVPALLRIGTASETPKIEIEAGPAFYFEEGELLVPPTFDPTPEEKKS
jgi:hypothetical protein